MPSTSQSEKPDPIVTMTTGDFITVLILGGIVGLILWGLGLMLNVFVFEGYFCEGDVTSQCGNSKNYAVVAATLLTSVAALAALVRIRVYRPLLVLIASILSTWGVVQLSWELAWLVGALVSTLLSALAFGTFAWLARVREFWISLAIIIVLVVITRIVING